MGLDATVRCNCFEQGKLTQGPIPFEDLYIDKEGYLSSRRLDRMHEKYDYRQFSARYEELQDAFYRWSENCCEHEDGNYCDEWVGNLMGCAKFRHLVKEAGGEDEFPLLSHLLPLGNDGIYPAEKAPATIDELDPFVKKLIEGTDEWALCKADNDHHDPQIWSASRDTPFVWEKGPDIEIGLRVGDGGGVVYFSRHDESCVETTHFSQVPLIEPDGSRPQRMRIEFLDGQGSVEISRPIGQVYPHEDVSEFYVTDASDHTFFEGTYQTAERLKRLLVASMETGNPIRWC